MHAENHSKEIVRETLKEIFQQHLINILRETYVEIPGPGYILGEISGEVVGKFHKYF